jgi:hypothetical protein
MVKLEGVVSRLRIAGPLDARCGALGSTTAGCNMLAARTVILMAAATT